MSLKIDKVSKSFSSKLVVYNISLELNKPGVFGLLGTNGAGKTTTIRMLLGILKKDSGTITWNDSEVDRKKVISKLYKVIANNVDIIITNVEIIKKYTDIDEYLDGDNYNLIKVKDLEKKIEFVMNKYHVTDIEDINNRLIEYVFENKTSKLWGEEDA